MSTGSGDPATVVEEQVRVAPPAPAVPAAGGSGASARSAARAGPPGVGARADRRPLSARRLQNPREGEHRRPRMRFWRIFQPAGRHQAAAPARRRVRAGRIRLHRRARRDPRPHRVRATLRPRLEDYGNGRAARAGRQPIRLALCSDLSDASSFAVGLVVVMSFPPLRLPKPASCFTRPSHAAR